LIQVSTTFPFLPPFGQVVCGGWHQLFHGPFPLFFVICKGPSRLFFRFSFAFANVSRKRRGPSLLFLSMALFLWVLEKGKFRKDVLTVTPLYLSLLLFFVLWPDDRLRSFPLIPPCVR